MRTEIRESLTGKTVYITGLAVLGAPGTVFPPFEATVLHTCFHWDDTVEAVHVKTPAGYETTVFDGWTVEEPETPVHTVHPPTWPFDTVKAEPYHDEVWPS